MFARLLLLAMLPWLLLAQQPAPPVPFVDEGACPFECCVYRDWIATTTVAARQGWVANATSATPNRILFSVVKGETITAMTGVVITIKPGQLKMLAAATTFGGSRNDPFASVTVELRRDDVIFLLTPHGESVYTAWVRGRLVDSLRTEDLQADGKVQVLDEPRTEWWVKIRNAKGQIGWTNRPQAFRNKDACGQP